MFHNLVYWGAGMKPKDLCWACDVSTRLLIYLVSGIQ
jgi:hypothetical protein